ncbi:MAG: hypothetical protein IPM97_10410 [Bdellovibrionaceae bacterium]|nr:hypothetical protein [Pseudobdellovibrionaceae bacterium]
MAMQKYILALFVTVTAVASNVFGACTDCRALDLDKKIQLHLVRPMWAMTSSQKIEYVRSFGLDLYKVKDIERDPARLDYLPEPSIKENPTWEKFVKIFDEGVMGLFLTPSNASNRVKNPTIFYNESADDWTIVHEFMHYLFDRARLLDDTTAESRVVNNLNDAKEDFFDYWNSYRENSSFRNEAHKNNMIRSFVTFLEAQIYLLKNFELEEVVIERYLRSVYLNQKPKNFRRKNFARGERYIRSTVETVQEHTRVMLETCDDMKTALGDNDSKLRLEVDAVCDQVKTLKDYNQQALLRI